LALVLSFPVAFFIATGILWFAGAYHLQSQRRLLYRLLCNVSRQSKDAEHDGPVNDLPASPPDRPSPFSVGAPERVSRTIRRLSTKRKTASISLGAALRPSR